MAGGNSTFYLYGSGDGSHPEGEYNGAWQNNVLVGGAVVATVDASGNVQYLAADMLGATRQTELNLTSASDATRFYRYGEEQNAVSSEYLWTGQMRDPNGLDHFAMRTYAPALGRWLTPDPAGLGAVDPNDPQTWNRYCYTSNLPVSASDPEGLDMVAAGRTGKTCTWDGIPTDCGSGNMFGSEVCDGGCSELGSGYVGAFGGSFSLVPGVNGPTFVNNLNGAEVSQSAADEEGFGWVLDGLADPGGVDFGPPDSGGCAQVPSGTSSLDCGALKQGLAAANKALTKPKCGTFYGGQGGPALAATEYRFVRLNDEIGAETIDATHVFINSSGPFMNYTAMGGSAGPFGRNWTPALFRGFILLHELGHQLSPITGFQADAGSLGLNESQSRMVLSRCF